MARVLASGVEAFTLTEYLDSLRNALTAAFGDIDTSDESPQMQLLSLVALALTQADESVVAIQNAFNLGTALGEQLDNLGTLLNIPRVGATRTRLTQSVRGTPATLIYAGVLASTASGDLFQSISPTTVEANGTVSIGWHALFEGPIMAAPLTRLVTTVADLDGLVGVAITGAVVGRNRETDTQYRTRLRASISRNQRGQADALTGEVLAVDNVRDVRIEVNNTNATEVRAGISIAAHSVLAIWREDVGTTVVLAEIAAAMDKIVAFGIGRTYRQAQARRMNVSFEITPEETFASDGDGQIKDAMVAHVDALRTGVSLQLNELYGPIYSVPGHAVTSAGLTVMWNAASADDAPDAALPDTIDLNLHLNLAFADILITRP